MERREEGRSRTSMASFVDRVQAEMIIEDRLVRSAEIGSRIVRDEPGRARKRGATVLRPELELGELSEPSTPPEFDTDRVDYQAA